MTEAAQRFEGLSYQLARNRRPTPRRYSQSRVENLLMLKAIPSYLRSGSVIRSRLTERALATALLGAMSDASGQAIEMQSNAGGPAGDGPTVSDQVVSMRLNPDNPTGSAFIARTPPVTVTFSLSNQQYSGFSAADGWPSGSGGNAVLFGAGGNSINVNIASDSLYGEMRIGSPRNDMFTSAGNSTSNGTTGTGISTSSNGSVRLFTSFRALYLRPPSEPTTGRLQVVDLTLNFSEAVLDPVLHFSGLGGISSHSLGITTELDLLGGLTWTKLSGNGSFAVSSTSVGNDATVVGSDCRDNSASCGSVRVNTGSSGTSIIRMRAFLRGDGRQSTWEVDRAHYPDIWGVGVSLNPVADLVVYKTNTIESGVSDLPDDTVLAESSTAYTVTVTNNGPDSANGAVVRDSPGSGIVCPSGNPVTITGDGVPSGTFTVADLTGPGIALGELGSGQSAAFTFTCDVD